MSTTSYALEYGQDICSQNSIADAEVVNHWIFKATSLVASGEDAKEDKLITDSFIRCACSWSRDTTAESEEDICHWVFTINSEPPVSPPGSSQVSRSRSSTDDFGELCHVMAPTTKAPVSPHFCCRNVAAALSQISGDEDCSVQCRRRPPGTRAHSHERSRSRLSPAEADCQKREDRYLGGSGLRFSPSRQTEPDLWKPDRFSPSLPCSWRSDDCESDVLGAGGAKDWQSSGVQQHRQLSTSLDFGDCPYSHRQATDWEESGNVSHWMFQNSDDEDCWIRQDSEESEALLHWVFARTANFEVRASKEQLCRSCGKKSCGKTVDGFSLLQQDGVSKGNCSKTAADSGHQLFPCRTSKGSSHLPDLKAHLLQCGAYEEFKNLREGNNRWRECCAKGADVIVPIEDFQSWRDAYRCWRTGGSRRASKNLDLESPSLAPSAAPTTPKLPPVIYDVVARDGEPALVTVDGPETAPMLVKAFPPEAVLTIRVFRFLEDRSDESEEWEKGLLNVNSGSIFWLPWHLTPNMHTKAGAKYGTWFTIHCVQVYAKHFHSAYHMCNAGSSAAKTFGSSKSNSLAITGESMQEGYFWYVSPAAGKEHLRSEGWRHLERAGPFDGNAFCALWQEHGSPMQYRALQAVLAKVLDDAGTSKLDDAKTWPRAATWQGVLGQGYSNHVICTEPVDSNVSFFGSLSISDIKPIESSAVFFGSLTTSESVESSVGSFGSLSTSDVS